MTSPRRILVPDQLWKTGGERHEIQPAVAVEVGRDDLIAAGKTSRDLVRGEGRRRVHRRVSQTEDHRAAEADQRATHCRSPKTTILLAADPPGQIGDRIPTAMPIRCLPPAR